MLSIPFPFPIRPLLAATVVAVSAMAASAEPLRGVIDDGALAGKLGQKNLVVLDIRSDDTREKGVALFKACRVFGADYGDYAHACWRQSRQNTSVYLAELAQFEAQAGDLGIGGSQASRGGEACGYPALRCFTSRGLAGEHCKGRSAR